jgi:hypothetical protein
MKIVNTTPIVAQGLVAADHHGREYHMVVVKATYEIPPSGPCTIAAKQDELCVADEYYGEPADSSIRRACDFPFRKPYVDIALAANACAPRGTVVRSLLPTLSIRGLFTKTLEVIGDRYWDSDLVSGLHATPAEPFESMPIAYERAFGGADVTHQDQNRHRFHRQNLVGVGIHSNSDSAVVVGKKLPNVHPVDRLVSRWGDTTETVGFGFISPQWLPRISYGGTYDQAWLDTRYPLPPVDFDERFHQSAPPDQQVRAIRGGEEILLKHMHPDGEILLILPRLDLSLTFLFKGQDDQRFQVTPDTLTLFPSERKFTATWRCAVDCAKKLTSLRQVVIGEKPPRWYAMQRSPKPHYRSLSEMMLAKER